MSSPKHFNIQINMQEVGFNDTDQVWADSGRTTGTKVKEKFSLDTLSLRMQGRDKDLLIDKAIAALEAEREGGIK